MFKGNDNIISILIHNPQLLQIFYKYIKLLIGVFFMEYIFYNLLYRVNHLCISKLDVVSIIKF